MDTLNQGKEDKNKDIIENLFDGYNYRKMPLWND